MTLKGSFVSGKAAVSTLHPCPPSRLEPAFSGLPPTTCYKSIIFVSLLTTTPALHTPTPPRPSGFEVGKGGREALAGKERHPLFPKDVIHSQMSFPEKLYHPVNPGMSSLCMIWSSAMRRAEHEHGCTCLCPPAHIWGQALAFIHTLIDAFNKYKFGKNKYKLGFYLIPVTVLDPWDTAGTRQMRSCCRNSHEIEK